MNHTHGVRRAVADLLARCDQLAAAKRVLDEATRSSGDSRSDADDSAGAHEVAAAEPPVLLSRLIGARRAGDRDTVRAIQHELETVHDIKILFGDDRRLSDGNRV